MYSFEKIYLDYCRFVKPFPKKYAELIRDTFKLKEEDLILDFGCGSGELKRMFAKYSNLVEGSDVSLSMIELAKKNDVDKKVKWFLYDICNHKLTKSNYKLIFSFEVIHLIKNNKYLLEILYENLKINGFLCVGWCVFNWERVLCNDLCSFLQDNNVNISNWFFQIPNSFIETFHNSEEMYIKVNQIWTAFEISNYIVSTSLFAEEDIKKRKELQSALEDFITKKYGDSFLGDSCYYIRYMKKGDTNV